VANYFYPDTDHNDFKIANAFRARLQGLAQQEVKTVFMEFLPEIVPEGDDLIEHFATHSGGRRYMASSYLGIVHEARRLGMRVVGLSRPQYPALGRLAPAQNLGYRMMGPYDGVAACDIKRTAGASPYVIFLGAGHWPILSHFITGLQLLVGLNEKLPELADVEGCNMTLWGAQKVADDLSGRGFSKVVLEAGCAHRGELDSLVERCNGTEELGRLLEMARDKLGKSPDILQINYLLAMRRRPEFQRPGLLRLA